MATIPSIAMIPSGVKASKLYSVLPTDGTGDFTTTRASVATRVNENGLIEEVAANVPRLDYSDGTCPSLLLEGTATNLIPYSEDFSNASWTKSSGGTASVPSITSNYATSPDGTLNADRVIFDLNGGSSGGDLSILNETVIVSNGSTTTKSIYLKSNNGSVYNISIYDGANVSNPIQAVVNGNWQRFEITQAVPSTSSTFVFGLRNDFGVTTSDNADILIYGAQLEENSYATSYIKNEGTALGVTRVAEQGNNNVGSAPIFSNTSAVWFIDLERTGIDTSNSGSAISLRNSLLSEQIRLHFDAPTSQVRFRDGENAFTTISTVTGMSANSRKKIALRIDGSTLSTFAAGGKIGIDYTAPNPFDIDSIKFSGLGFKIHDIRFYTTALSDAELTTLTTI